MMSARTYATTIAGLLVGAQACATAPHSEQFNEARKTYQEAAQGKAAELTPDELLRAENLLRDAEAAGNNSAEEKHLAYLAHRQAQIAQSSAQKRSMNEQLAELKDKRTALQERAREQAEKRAESYREKYEETQESKEQIAQELEEIKKEKEELQKQLDDMSGQLEGLAEVVRKKDELVLTISGSVLFETDESQLMPAAKNKLQRVASVLQGREGWEKIIVVGHTDDRGPSEYNQKLSKERATSVRQYLIDQGIAREEIEAEGEGESEPIASNKTSAGRARNRRVELHIKDKGKGSRESSPQYGMSD